MGLDREPADVARIALRVGAALVVVTFVVLGVLQARHDSLTLDEGVYLSGGVVAWERHDLRLSPEQPPLGKLVAGLPAWAAGARSPDTPALESGDWFRYTDDFMAEQRREGVDGRVIFAGRVAVIAVSLLAAWGLYLLAARLGGRAAGVLAMTMWLSIPVVVGLGHVITTDVALVAAVAWVAVVALRHLDRPTDATALILGLATGAALLTRHSALAIIPVVLAVAGWARPIERHTAARRVAITAFTAWVLVWICYRLVAPDGVDGMAADRLRGFVDEGAARSWVAQVVLLVPWPLEYGAGIGYLATTAGSPPGYLLGAAWAGSRWWYWPGVAMVKLPITWWLLVAGGAVAGWRRRGEHRDERQAVVAIVAAFLVLGILASGRNIGLRYMLAPVSLITVLVAVWLAPLLRIRWVAAGVVSMVALQLAVLIASHPQSLAWVNPGARPAYRSVSDSDVDWGQDRRRLADLLEERDEVAWEAVFGGRGALPLHRTRHLADAPDDEALGLVAVSASNLTAYRRDELSWLRAYCPVEVVGASILLYRFDAPPDRRPGPSVPARPCGDGVTSHR